VRIPHFFETNHPLIKSLVHYSDQDLLTLFQRYPEQGKHFVALVVRYSPIVYTLISHSARSPVQADYLFGMTWRHIFFEMRGLDLRGVDGSENTTFQNWLINQTAFCINQMEVPPVEMINYNLKDAPPPLWCYLEQALELLPPLVRLILIMGDNFRWSETRISAYLQAEGDEISPAEIHHLLQQGRQMLEEALPEDIRAIYLEQKSKETTNNSQLDLTKVG
jgi:hypothetical protein